MCVLMCFCIYRTIDNMVIELARNAYAATSKFEESTIEQFSMHSMYNAKREMFASPFMQSSLIVELRKSFRTELLFIANCEI